MNLLQVSTSPRYPPKSGGDHRCHGLLTAFLDADDTIIRYSQRSSLSAHFDTSFQETVDIARNYREVRNVSLLENTSRVLGALRLPSSPTLGLYLRLRPTERLRSFVRWADIILVEGPWQVYPLAKMAADTPVVYSSHNVEFKHYEHLSSGLTWPLFAWIRHIERKAVQSADGVVCVSRSDIEQFRETWEFEADLFLVPNAIYESDLAQSPAEEGITVDVPDEIPEGKTTCLFVGSNRPQNVQAARSLVSLASSFRGDIHVVIVGSVGRAISKLPPNVTTTGFVDDLNPYYFHSDVALNPVTAGAGTNIKLLEYFAKQIPVISTRFGIRGYDIDDGYHVTVASPEKMLEAASELTRSVKRRRRQTEAAFEFVRTRTWRNVSSKLRSDLETAFFDHS